VKKMEPGNPSSLPGRGEPSRWSATGAIETPETHPQERHRNPLSNPCGRGVRAAILWSGELISRLVRGRPIRALSEVHPFLFIGGQHLKRGLPELRSWGISAVVSMRDDFDDRASGIAPERYLNLPVIDNTAPTMEQLMRGVEFIERERRRGGKVYVHCKAGAGRAPTMAAAYLVATGHTAEEAWRELRGMRPFIHPHRSQRACIREFAEACSRSG
jgi:hypothetical protein